MLLIPLVYLALFGVFILSGLFAILVSTRQWHWFLRSTILIASVLPILLVDADDLMLILLVSQMVILMGVLYGGKQPDRSASKEKNNRHPFFSIPKFKLSDLMLSVITACGLMALVSQAIVIHLAEFIHLVGIGFAFGFWSLMAIAVVDWKVNWRKKLIFFFVGMNGTLIWAALDDQWLTNGINQTEKLFFWCILLMIVSAYIFLTVSMVRFLKRRRPMELGIRPFIFRGHPMTALLFVFLVTTFIGITGSTVVCYSWLLMPPQEPTWIKRMVPGEPNGFDDFVSAGKALSQSPLLNLSTPTLPGQPLRTEIEAYSASFDQVRVGLSRENQLCLDLLSDNPTNFNLNPAAMRRTLFVRQAVIAFGLKSRQAIADGNHDEAVDNGLQCIQMAQCLSQGILITHLQGIACEKLGSHWIQMALENATSPKLEEAAATLKQIDSDSFPLVQVFANEQYCMWKTTDWKGRMFNRAIADFLFDSTRELLETATARRDSVRAQLRTAIALELFKRNHGSFPESLDQLVPDYLDQVLADPFPLDSSNDSLKYICDDSRSSYQLYSVNLNGTDEGGRWDVQSERADMNYARMVQKDEAHSLASAKQYAATLTENDSKQIPID